MRKVAIVTGASRGIGRQVALEIADIGYELVLIARTKEKLIEIADEITKKYKLADDHKPLVVPLDVADESKVNESVSNLISMKGSVDVLFNNAAIFEVGSF